VGQIGAVSSVYRSDPVGFRDQPEFWNLVARVRTRLEPEPLLRAVKTLETALGRTPTFRQGPREIDIDLLLYGDRVVDAPGLAVPHPRMMERAFVLAPLVELSPEAHHPVTHDLFADRLAHGGLEPVERLFDGMTLLTGAEEP
jgi:2-amino-4-hydroxy-6-hydroxymethyldihydropteridine diphosphokinase